MPGWPLCLVMQKPGVGAVGGSRLGCRVTSTLGRQEWVGPEQPPKRPGVPGSPGAVGPPVLLSC